MSSKYCKLLDPTMSITKLLDALSSLSSNGLARSAGRPAGAAWAPRARPGRPCWLDLASIGSLWLPLAPLLARFGLVWLDLAAPAALAGSIWLLCALLGAPAGSIWLPTTTPSTRLAKKKKRFAYRRSCFDAACFVRSGTFLHASKLICYRVYCETLLPQEDTH